MGRTNVRTASTRGMEMKDVVPGLMLTIYLYDEQTGYRQQITETHSTLKSAEESLFMHRLKQQLIGYQIHNHHLPKRHTLIKEWWDRSARKNYATADDYPDNPSRVWLDK